MKKNLILIALSSMLLSTAILADEIDMPVVKKPDVLLEGTQQTLTAEQIESILPWAKDSKNFLADLISSTQGLNTNDKIDRLTDGIKQTVGESAPKKSELFMRYILNRSLVIAETLDAEIDRDAVGSNDTKLRVLLTSAKLAIKYYDIDLKSLTNKTAMPFEVFGIDYFNFLNDLNKSIFDASAQYKIQRTSLEWLQWDLYRSLNNTTYAAQIVKLNNALKILPSKKISDAQSIANIKQMKKIIELLDIPEIKNTSERLEQNNNNNNSNVFEVDDDNEYAKFNDGKQYHYSTSREKCFPVSQDNNIMYSSPVDSNFCFQVGNYHYSRSREKCFKVSKGNDIMYSDRVEDKFCAAKESFHYSTSRQKCYKVSGSNDIMYSSHVSDNYCAQEDSYHYSTSREKCFQVSKSNDIMYSSRLDDQFCAQENKYYYSSSRAACFKQSKSNDIMYSSKVNNSYCTN